MATITQLEPLDANQVRNNAGGFVYEVSRFQRLRRFFCLGVEGGTYYVSEKALIFTLALCARLGDERTKKAAYEALNAVCRIPTSLFMFVGFCEAVSDGGSGWGRAHRRAVSDWYNSKSAMDLAMHITKYQNREGWTHLDLLRLSHTVPQSPAHALIFRYIVKKQLEIETTGDLQPDDLNTVDSVRRFLNAVEEAKKATMPEDIIRLIAEHSLVREHVPTTLLNSRTVWEYLLVKMPLTAMIRNLGKMSALGLFTDAENTEKVTSRLRNEEALKRARI
eukprot:Colp12_sorted_trinity150504_noHs@24244